MAFVNAEAHGDDVRIKTDVGKLDSCLYEAVIAGLGTHLGFDPEPLRKALTPLSGETPDPRFPEMQILIDRARRNWSRWGDELIEAVKRLAHSGRLYPLNPASEALLSELFREHRVGVIATITGHNPDPEALAKMLAAGRLKQQEVDHAPVPAAYHLGRALPMLKPVPMVRPDLKLIESNIDERIAAAIKGAPSAIDKAAVKAASRRAAVYMRKPIEAVAQGVDRELGEEELAIVRRTISTGIAERKDQRTIQRDLVGAVAGTSLLNDMERVVRTEVHLAHSTGAYVALKAQAKRSGMDDPDVFKFVSPDSCTDCRRIWGPLSNPHKYKLSFIEQRDAGGGNYKKPRRDWGPTIGPVHPNCTEGPLQVHTQAIIDDINDISAQMRRYFP